MNAASATGPAGRRILLVEDEPLLRDFLAQMLTDAGYVVRACGSADDAVREFAVFDPDALLSDIDLGGGASGIDLAISLAARAPYLRIIFLSSYSIPPNYRNPEIARAAYVNKRDITGTVELLTVVDGAFRGKPVSPAGTQAGGALAKLTPTQASVLRLMATGASNEEIAAQRGSTVGAVEHIISRIFTALGISSESGNTRVTAVKMYYEAAGRPSSGDSLDSNRGQS